MVNTLIKQVFARNCLTFNSPRRPCSCRCIRLVLRKPPPLQRYVKDNNYMFGPRLTAIEKTPKVNIDLTAQPDTEFSCFKRATIYPWRKLIRNKKYFHPEVPVKWIRFPHAMYNRPRVLFRSRRTSELNQAKIKKKKDNNLKHKELISEATSPTTLTKKHLPPESHVTEIVRGSIIFDEDIIKRNIPQTLDVKLCRTLKDDKTCMHLPSVTKILKKIESQHNAYAKILDDEQGMEREECILTEEDSQRGVDVESHFRQLLCGKTSKIPDASTLILRSLKNQFKKVKDIIALHTQVVHPTLLYKGCVDCVASYKGSLSVIEWLTTDDKTKTQGSIYHASVRLAACIGALNASKNYPSQIRKGVIIIAQPCGKVATASELNEHKLRMYWHIWQQQLHRFYFIVKR